MPAWIAALFGLAMTGVLLLAADGLRRRTRTRTVGVGVLRLSDAVRMRLAGGLAAGLLAAVATGWPVAGLLVAAAIVGLPPLLAGSRAAKARSGRIEAVGAWAEMLSATLASAAGLEQTILATAVFPPPAITGEVTALADDLARRVRLDIALHRFAQSLADPIVAQLTLASAAPAGRLGDALAQMARMAREHVAIRLRVEADRAGIRTSIRMVVAVTAALAAGLAVFDRPFLRPYDTLTGQLVLVVLGAGFTAAFVLLARMSRFAEPPRVLAADTSDGGAR
jgi:hypothetical protein